MTQTRPETAPAKKARIPIRSDQVAGGAFIVLGGGVLLIGWDLPFGRLSAPGAGMFPKLLAGLMIVFAVVTVSGRRGTMLSDIAWHDAKHAVAVLGFTSLATLLYVRLGFLITMSLLVFGLLVTLERKKMPAAAVYAALVVVLTYWLFAIVLKAPLEHGVLWF
jgi:hypothetical protein